MDKDTPSHVPDTPDGSTGGDEKGRAKYPVFKDRKCQYCLQTFTSSSLGRHLDQFLYKKKPDGIHNVEEIRQIRSGITRRQARTSSVKRDEASEDKGQPDSTLSRGKDGRRRSRQEVRMMFNTPTWHATGVINDIPDPNTSRDSAALRPGSSTGFPPRFAGTGADPPNPNTMRALELALREVLDSVKAAGCVFFFF